MRWRGGLHYNRIVDQSGQGFASARCQHRTPWRALRRASGRRASAGDGADAQRRLPGHRGLALVLMVVLLVLPVRTYPPRIAAGAGRLRGCRTDGASPSGTEEAAVRREASRRRPPARWPLVVAVPGGRVFSRRGAGRRLRAAPRRLDRRRLRHRALRHRRAARRRPGRDRRGGRQPGRAAGQVLVTIDDRDFRAALATAEARWSATGAGGDAGGSIGRQPAVVDQSQAQGLRARPSSPSRRPTSGATATWPRPAPARTRSASRRTSAAAGAGGASPGPGRDGAARAQVPILEAQRRPRRPR